MAVKRLLLLAMLCACSVQAAQFGDIPASLAIPASQSVRRNAGNTAFEAYTPGSGGTSLFTALDFTNSISVGYLVNASNTVLGLDAFSTVTTGNSNTIIGTGAGANIADGVRNVIIGATSDVPPTQTGSSGITLLGYSTGNENPSSFNATAIGFGARVSADNTAVIGNSTVTDLYAGSESGNSIIHAAGAQFNGLTPNGIIIATGSNGTLAVATPTSTPTPTATFTPTATPTATATATATPTPSATATAFPQGFTAHFSRGGAALQVNDVTLTPWTTKYPGTITGFIISADQGTCTLKVWKKATGTAIPTIANVINTSGVSLATGTHIDSTTVTDFTTTTVSIGDQFMAQITAVSGGATDITFQVPIRQ